MKKTLLAILSLLCTAALAGGLAACDLFGNGDSSTTTPPPASSSTVKPEDSSSAKPEDSSSAKPEDSSSAKPEDSSSAKPEDSSSAKPEDSSSAKPEDSSPEEDTTVGEITLGNEGVLVVELGVTEYLPLSATFGEEKWSLAAKDYEIELSNDNFDCQKGQVILIQAPTKAGVTTITVKAEDSNGNEVTATKTVVVNPRDLSIVEEALGSSNIEGVFTLGGSDVAGNAVSHTFTVSTGAASEVGAGLNEHIVWESSSKSVTVDKGVVTLAKTGEAELVSLTAKLVVDGKTCLSSNPYTFRAVYEGVNIGNYADLVTATKAKKTVVLNANIAFPTQRSEIDVIPMKTTYDDTYQQNLNKINDTNNAAQINTLLQFRNDLYGNGYVINAHNATRGLMDGVGALTPDSIFRGPLNFVAMSQSGGAISVKGQDNVCFAVFEGVTVNNVELRGCDLQADKDGNYELTDLDYVGTTVEVFGDDVSIEYSRIYNGRTVLRVFGDEKDATKVLNLNIQNSVLSGAREFIIRMGSNCFVQDKDVASPYIDANDTTAHLTKETYNTKTAAEKAAYDAKYIKTFVTLKNSVLKDAGIFAIGIDAHFAGAALHDAEAGGFGGILKDSTGAWKDLAKTSYGAKLTFEGEVKLYNWKPLDQIDSSTLIEMMKLPGTERLDFEEELEFNVAEMVKYVADNAAEGSAYSKIITEDNWVHAGIAFFGGGKNYGVFDNATNLGLSSFPISLSDVQKGFLTSAAGNEHFYFTLYLDDENSEFKPADQEKSLAPGGDGYNCIYNKD